MTGEKKTGKQAKTNEKKKTEPNERKKGGGTCTRYTGK